MSAAFQLQFTGAPAPCSFPHCIREAFHDGEHEFKADKRVLFPLPDSDDALISHYGAGTRSWNRSSAKAEMDRQIEHAQLRAANQPRAEYLAPLLCPCAQRPYAHDLEVHAKLQHESFNPAKRWVWPWVLMQSERVEPSTEGRKSA